MLSYLPAVGAVGVVVLVIFYLFIFGGKGKMRKEVLFLRPRDKRGERLDVTRETDRSVLCENSNPVHRFIKAGPAWVFKDGGRTVVRFIGIEGNAFTAFIKDGGPVKMAIDEFLKSIWTPQIYEKLPEKLKKAVENPKVGIIVEPAPIDVETLGLPKLTSDDVNDEGDAVVLSRLAKGSEPTLKERLYTNLVWLFLGIGIAAILSNFGWF